MRSPTPTASLALAVVLGTFAIQAPTPLEAQEPEAVFEDDSLSARQKEFLLRYARSIETWGMVQRVSQAVVDQNAEEMPMEEILEIDEAWKEGRNPRNIVDRLQSNRCAEALRAALGANPGYGEAFVSDRRGALVGATNRTTDYWQGDEEKWEVAYGEGKGGIFVGRSEFDESAGIRLIQISVPVRYRGEVVGVLTVGKLMGTTE